MRPSTERLPRKQERCTHRPEARGGGRRAARRRDCAPSSSSSSSSSQPSLPLPLAAPPSASSSAAASNSLGSASSAEDSSADWIGSSASLPLPAEAPGEALWSGWQGRRGQRAVGGAARRGRPGAYARGGRQEGERRRRRRRGAGSTQRSSAGPRGFTCAAWPRAGPRQALHRACGPQPRPPGSGWARPRALPPPSRPDRGPETAQTALRPAFCLAVSAASTGASRPERWALGAAGQLKVAAGSPGCECDCDWAPSVSNVMLAAPAQRGAGDAGDGRWGLRPCRLGLVDGLQMHAACISSCMKML